MSNHNLQTLDSAENPKVKIPLKENNIEVLEYIRLEMAGMRRYVNVNMKDMTSELFNGTTSGTTNTISATFIHFMNAEDNFIHKVIQGKSSVWDSGSWGEKTSIPKPPSIGEDWSNFKHRQIPIQLLLDYQSAVWSATDAYLTTLTPEELDRKVEFAGAERTVADMLLLSTSQSLSHVGEIAALKGVQGAKGFLI